MRWLPLTVALVVVMAAGAGGQARTDPSATVLLSRAAAWLATLEQEFAVVVADETYRQQIGTENFPNAPRENFRDLQSEVVFLWVPDEGMWVTARNVRTVDKQPVDGSSRRIQQILSEAATRLQFLRGLRSESARFNLGGVLRNFNDPTFALQYLGARWQDRFRWIPRSAERVRGVATTRLDFTESTSPYLIQSATEPLQSTGSAWIESTTGIVYQTRLDVWDPAARVRARIDVDLARDGKLGLVVPIRMKEEYTVYSRAGATVDISTGVPIFGTAAYSNFRRFETSGRLIGP